MAKPASAPRAPVEIDLHGMTHGAEAVGRLPDGKACFVAGGIPGERVRVRVVKEKKRWARADLLEVLTPSPDRVEPPCPYYGTCGGCALQHVAPARQAELKRRIVIEQLERIGGFTEPPVRPTVVPAQAGYREQARLAPAPAGRLGFRRRGSARIVPIDRCLLLTDETHALREAVGDDWAGVDEVLLRVGGAWDPHAIWGADQPAPARHGVVTVVPGVGGLPTVPAGPDAVAIDSPSGPVPLRGEPSVVKEVGGARYRVSAGSFFQAGTLGAEALVGLVRRAAAVVEGDIVLDLYAGVGLFARALADDGAVVTAVESHPSAVTDALHNLAGVHAEVRGEPAEDAVAHFVATHRWFDVVVLDPPRAGAGQETAARLAALEPRTVVYVSCDPAALARDARALEEAGLRLEAVTPVDLFAHTAAIEAVAVFRRDGAEDPSLVTSGQVRTAGEDA